jgi:pimeloyl-ACP methyl ester carboxylesterase
VLEALAVRANGITFHALAAGPPAGPLVLLLHGFPELARSWRHQLPALGALGYRAVAPDLRGYGRTTRQGPYDVRTLSADVAGLVRALGRARAVICGHDWGGAVAWAAATYVPEVVERLVVLNCPHPGVLARELVRNPRQLARSSYMLLFQLPWLPERLLSRRRAGAVVRMLARGPSVKSAFPPEELERYREAFSDPAAVSAALGYYRAAFRSPVSFARDGIARPVAAPTLILWGVADRALGPETIDPEKMARFFAPGRRPEIVWLAGVGHFTQNEAPERVNAELARWLGPASRPPA